jgi:hypothetical protein
MSSIGDILQLKLNEKIKIPVHKLNLPGLRTSVHPVLVMNQIQSLYSNVVPEKRMIPQN